MKTSLGTEEGSGTVRTASAIIAGFLLLLTIAGCKRGEVTATEQQKQDEQQAALQDLLKYAQETGQTLEQLRQTLSEWKAAQEAEEGPSPVQVDLDVLDGLLEEAKKKVEAHDSAGSLRVITRMSRVARGLLAELPGQQVALRAERALAALRGERPDASGASRAILSAVDVCVKAKDAPLVPNVVKDLEAAKAAVADDPARARERLEAVLNACAKDKAARWAYFLVKGLEGAFEAVSREAWPVAAAELEQAGRLIKKLRAAAHGQTAEETARPPAEETKTAPEQPRASQQQPSAPARQSRSAAAVGKEQEAGGSQMPQAPPQSESRTSPPAARQAR